jgi:probable HAF family extracellular repeat protein
MKSAKMTCVTAIALLVALAIPVSLAAQEHQNKHHKYNLVDIGTLGGPNVFFNFSGGPNTLLGSKGTVTGGADTTTVDPYCFDSPDCFVEHAFKWQEGVLTDLGALPGGTGNNNSQAFWINDRGQTVGLSTNGTKDPLTGYLVIHAVLWSAQGKIHDLGTFGGYLSLSQAINKQGQVVGFATNTIPDPNAMFLAGQQVRAFLWDPKTKKMRDLGTLGTGNDAFASYVNDRGQVAGQAYTNTTPNSENTYWCGNKVPTTDPFFWDGTKMWDIGTLGGDCGVALGLNNNGQVMGVSYMATDLVLRAFRWDKRVRLQKLDTLGGTGAGTYGIDDAGDVLGWANPVRGGFHPVIWPSGTTKPIDLGVVKGYTNGTAQAINSSGQIIGCLTNTNVCDANAAAFLWENGDMVDLNTLVPPHPGVQLTGGDEYINDLGEIVTSGALSNGDYHAFLLTYAISTTGTVGETAGSAPRVQPSRLKVGGWPNFSGVASVNRLK